MTVIGKIGRPHGKKGVVKVIPNPEMYEIFEQIRTAVVLSDDGEQCELENIRSYNRGRFVGTLNGYRTKEEVEKFSGSVVAVK